MWEGERKEVKEGIKIRYVHVLAPHKSTANMCY